MCKNSATVILALQPTLKRRLKYWTFFKRNWFSSATHWYLLVYDVSPHEPAKSKRRYDADPNTARNVKDAPINVFYHLVKGQYVNWELLNSTGQWQGQDRVLCLHFTAASMFNSSGPESVLSDVRPLQMFVFMQQTANICIMFLEENAYLILLFL